MAKQDKNDRQARIAAIRNDQKASDRRRGGMIIGAFVAVGVLIIGAAAYQPIKEAIDQREFDKAGLASIGAAATVCQDIITKPADGMNDHVEPGTPIDYTDAPPAFGRHYNIWATMDRKFYTDDRPDVGELVHNLEHGYTILWYDETIADDADALATVRGMAGTFDSSSNMRNKFKAVPWTSEDGEAFPEGQHVALTHWSAGGAGNHDTSQFQGVWQYCSEPSGAALADFMEKYPYMDSPEPNAV